MPSLAFGLVAYTSPDFLDKLQIAYGTELAKRRGTNGQFTKAHAFNPTNDITIQGGGGSGLVAGLVSLDITGITGGVQYLTKDQYSEHNTEYNDFDSSILHLPNAADD